MPNENPKSNANPDRGPEEPRQSSEGRRGGAVVLREPAPYRVSVQAVVKDNVEATTDYTRDVLLRNVDLAARLVPAYIDAYERTLKGVGDVWTQTGEAIVRVGATAAVAPKVLASSLAETGDALAAISQTVGTAVGDASRRLVQAPQAVGEQVGEHVRESVPALVGAPARLLTETAEVTSAAIRHRLADPIE